MATETERVELLYDGNCGSCGRFARAVRALDTEHRIEFVRLQDERVRREYEARLGHAYWHSFHLVEGGGRGLSSGADALPRLAELLPAVRPFKAVVFGTPGLKRLPAAAYELASFARACTRPHKQD